jgi:hypothetical protein
MATAAKQSKSTGTGTKATSKPASQKATGKGKPASKPKATSKRATYSEQVQAITERARGYAYPETRQGPVAKQVQRTMAALGDPRKALAEAGITQKALRAYANGSGDKEVRAALKPLGQRVVDTGAARQWVTGRCLAATLVAWLEVK